MRLCLACCAATLILSAPARADPVILVPDTDLRLEQDGERRGGPSDAWFFGDGGFGCPLWWCEDRDASGAPRVGAARQRPPRRDAGNDWFLGDGGFGCPQWRCDPHRPAAESE